MGVLLFVYQRLPGPEPRAGEWEILSSACLLLQFELLRFGWIRRAVKGYTFMTKRKYFRHQTGILGARGLFTVFSYHLGTLPSSNGVEIGRNVWGNSDGTVISGPVLQ